MSHMLLQSVWATAVKRKLTPNFWTSWLFTNVTIENKLGFRLKSRYTPTQENTTEDWLPFPWEPRPKHNVYEKSGDLVKRNIADPSWPKPDFEFSEELKNTSDESIKKMFSCASGSKRENEEAYRRRLLKRIQRHPLDFDSLEVKIAIKTVRVRSLFQHHDEKENEVVAGKVGLLIYIQRRNKMLNDLRKIDYERFSWLLNELELKYYSHKLQLQTEKYWRKSALRTLVKEYCDNIIKEKTVAYHDILKLKQRVFINEKLKALAWIEDEENELNMIKEKTLERDEYKNAVDVDKNWDRNRNMKSSL